MLSCIGGFIVRLDPTRVLSLACSLLASATLVAFITATPALAFDGFVHAYQVAESVGVATSFAVDFNGDGDLDLIEVYGAPEHIRSFRNDGNGLLELVAETPLPDAPFAVAIGDVDGDHVPDLAWAESVGSGSHPVTIYRGAVDGSFRVAQKLRKTNDVGGLAFAHLDGDAALDLVVARRAGSLDVYSGAGDGSLARTSRARQRERGVRDIVTGDFDADGDTDAITATSSGLLFFYAQGAGGRFSNGTRIDIPPAEHLREILVVDLNGDVFPDLIVSTGATSECPDSVYHGKGAGRFTRVQGLCNDGFADGTADLDVGDVDGDGQPDVVALRGGDLYYAGRADGTFEPGRPVFDSALFFSLHVTLGDIDGDGTGDAMIRDGECCNTATHVFLGQPGP
jgi:hypothetical protein